jgi:hypothetical protein
MGRGGEMLLLNNVHELLEKRDAVSLRVSRLEKLDIAISMLKLSKNTTPSFALSARSSSARTTMPSSAPPEANGFSST